MITRTGRAVLVCGIVLCGLGWCVGYAELLVLGVGALLAVGVAAVALGSGTRLVTSREILPTRVQRGEPAVAALEVTNLSARPSGALTAIEPVGGSTVEVNVPRLAPHAMKRVTYRLPTDRRGVVQVGPLRLERTDLLGLASRARQYGDSLTLHVHPLVHALEPLPSGRNLHLDGPTTDTAPNGTVTFHALREYVIGDELRHIHWRSTARTGTLMVRQHVDTSLPHLTVVLDTRSAAYRQDQDAFEHAVDVAASLSVASARRRFPSRLHTTGGLALRQRGADLETRDLLDRLAGLQMEEGGSMLDAVQAVGMPRRGSSLVVLTGTADSADLAAVVRSQRFFEHVVVARLGSQDAVSHLNLGSVRLIDAADTGEFLVAWRQVAG